jgi:hypothetical protein
MGSGVYRSINTWEIFYSMEEMDRSFGGYWSSMYFTSTVGQ